MIEEMTPKEFDERIKTGDLVEIEVPKIKQVIVWRNDLKVRKGKMAAQCSHASIAWLTNRMQFHHHEDNGHDAYILDITSEEKAWIDRRFTKVVVKVNSEEELLEIYDNAKIAGLTVYLITDAGLTEFAGEPTNTCLAIGPHSEELINPLTGDLELM